MNDCILGFWMPGPIEIIIILFYLGISIGIIVLILRFLLRNKKENIRLRLEVGKLADELEKVRKQKSTGKEDSSTDSG